MPYKDPAAQAASEKSYRQQPEVRVRKNDCARIRRAKQAAVVRAEDRARYSRDPDRQYKNQLKYEYGKTLEWYDETLAAQDGGCAICGGPQVGNQKRFHVDHDHQTDEVRGLLCATCNRGLGQFKDSSDLLAKAISYLKKHGK